MNTTIQTHFPPEVETFLVTLSNLAQRYPSIPDSPANGMSVKHIVRDGDVVKLNPLQLTKENTY